MKTTQLIRVALVAALCMCQAGAWAQPGHGNDNGRGNDCGNGRQNCDRGQDNNRDRGGYRHDNRRQDMGRHHDDGERGAGPDRSFYRGERLPPYYQSRQYVVDDWRGHGLHSPPRGYHWVQTGGDYVLVAITTGIILELLLNR